MRKTSWRPFYSASTWSTLWLQMHATMSERASKNARRSSADVTAPPLTNAEAVAFVRVWRGATTSDGPLGYQFAARAYGWNPPTSDTLRTDAKQAAAAYPDVADLWKWAHGIAEELDARNLGVPASVAPNRDTFGDPTFYGDVRARLQGDGARAAVATGKREIVVVAPKRESKSSAAWLLWVAAAWLLLSPKRRAPGRKARR